MRAIGIWLLMLAALVAAVLNGGLLVLRALRANGLERGAAIYVIAVCVLLGLSAAWELSDARARQVEED